MRGDGAVTVGGDYYPYGAALSVTGTSTVTAGDGEIGLLSTATDTIAAGFFNLSHNVVNIGHIVDQTADIGAGGMLNIYKSQTMNGFEDRAGMLEMHDSPFGSGNRDNVSVTLTIDSIVRARMYPRIVDGASDTAYIFDTKFSLSSANTKLLEARNQGVAKLTLNALGRLSLPGTPEYADNISALSAGLSVGTLYHTGGLLKIVI